MNFELTSEQNILRDQIRNFAEKEIGPARIVSRRFAKPRGFRRLRFASNS